jgi:hypothetical protein
MLNERQAACGTPAGPPESAEVRAHAAVAQDERIIAELPSIDAPYTWGRPKVYLNTHDLARLLILRSKSRAKDRS